MIKKPKIVPKNILKLHKDTIIGLQSGGKPPGSTLYSCSKDGCIRISDLVQKKILHTLYLSKNGPVPEKQDRNTAPSSELQKISLDGSEKEAAIEDLSSVFFTETLVYGGYKNGDIYCWNIQSGEVIQKLIGHTKTVNQLLHISPNILASSSGDNDIRCWDMKTGICEHLLKFDHPIDQVLQEGKNLYVLTQHNLISVLEVESYKLINSLAFKDRTVTAFAVKGNAIFAASTNCKIEAFEMQENNLEPKYLLDGHKDWIICMRIRDNCLFTGADDKTIKVWSLDQCKMIDEFSDHEDGVTYIEFCGDNLFSACFDYCIRYWSVGEIFDRVRERKIMQREDLGSRKYDAYCRVLYKGQKMINKTPNASKNAKVTKK